MSGTAFFFHCLAFAHAVVSAENDVPSALNSFYPLVLSLVVTSFNCHFFPDLPRMGQEPFFPHLAAPYHQFTCPATPPPPPHTNTRTGLSKLVSIKGRIVNILGFERHMVSVATIQHFYCIMKVTIDNTQINGCVQI